MKRRLLRVLGPRVVKASSTVSLGYLECCCSTCEHTTRPYLGGFAGCTCGACACVPPR